MTDASSGAPQTTSERALLLQAALDGELDATAMLGFERQLGEDPALAAEYRRLAALRQAIHKIPKVRASADFRARIAAIPGSQQKTSVPPPAKWWQFADWQQTAIAASLALMLGSGLTFLSLPPRGVDVRQDLLAGHIRGMIAGQPADVASSDRHTVKPWFATRITQAPQVVDLGPEGFILDGGRVDVIDGKPVATLIYRHLKHVISVTELPDSLADFGPAETHRTIKGYSILTWPMGDPPDNRTTFVAVSDIAPADLENLAAAFRKAVAAEH